MNSLNCLVSESTATNFPQRGVQGYLIVIVEEQSLINRTIITI
jgi:hypothetical protein